MKRKNLILNINRKNLPFIFLLVFFPLFSCAFEPLRVGVVSDIHYLSEQFMDNGEAINMYCLNSARNVKEAPAILDKVLNDYIETGIDVLLICGDLTKDGEKQSHLDIADKLSELTEKGIRVFVIPGNHDINIPNPVRYDGNQVIQIENVSAEEFRGIYHSYGYSSAINSDIHSLSYVAELSPDLWLLAVDACLYKEYTTSSLSAGKISPETEDWIIEILRQAGSKNIKVIAMMHHGLAEHFPLQATVFPDYLVTDWQRLAALFANNGVKAVFTGHFHANDITEYVSPAGNKIYDIETGALVSYPYPYRFIEITEDTLYVQTKNIGSIPSNPDLSEQGRLNTKLVAYESVLHMIESRKKDLPGNLKGEIADILSEILIMHAQGDEVISNELKERIENLASQMNIPVDLSSEFLQLDFPPADNNVKLSY